MTATARSSPPPSPRRAASRLPFGAFPDDEAALEKAVRDALDACDMVVLSGGTSKGAGDLSHRVVSRLGAPGILVHGVALKPGKPLCLGGRRRQADRGAARLSDLGDLHLPRFRRAGDPRAAPACRRKRRRRSSARVPVRIASELGRKEFVLVALVDGRRRARSPFRPARAPARSPAFSQADGFHRDRCAGHRARCRQRRRT